MKRNENYVLRYLNGVPYLLPYAQAQADLKRGCRLNETGVFLWNLLAQEQSLDELTNACSERYSSSQKELPFLRSDIESFLNSLDTRGFLAKHMDTVPLQGSGCKLFKIGRLVLKLAGSYEAFPPQLDPFACDDASSLDLTVFFRPSFLQEHPVGRLLLRNDELMVLEAEDRFVLAFPRKKHVKEAHISLDGSLADLYYYPPCSDDLREEIFHILRFLYLYLAQRHRILALHSASLLYRGRAWLFSGSSGAGKSTHTHLWKELYHVPLINGDLNLLAVENEQPVVHGLPWCGTSNIYDTSSYPLGGIILLKQAKENRLEELSPDTKSLFVLQRLISPTWTAQMLDINLNFTEELCPKIFVARLHCTKNPSAANVMKAGIDSFLDANAG